MIFLRILNFDFNKLLVSKELYDFSGDSVLAFLKDVKNEHKTILVFGHNYALTTLVNTLGDRYIENVPTSGLIKIEFSTDSWETIKKGRTTEVIFPKELR
jgi:phosphohistidine phosphatase